jgi:hypothetical protein
LKLIDALTPTPQHKKRASERLYAFTRNIHAVRVLHHVEFGDRLVLVETPGFDDKERSDMEILGLIGNWLKRTYVPTVSSLNPY